MKTIRIFISSPGDVAEERERAKRVVESLRKRYAGRLVLETVLWEELPLTATMTFQDGIEQVILSESYGVDVAVFVLWSRLGSPLGTTFTKPDGTPYRSGTEREFDLMLAAYEQSGETRPQIFAYVRQDQDGFIEAQRGKATSALSEMIRQRELVEAFIRDEFHDPETGANLRAYHTFPQPATFAVRLRQHLCALLDDMAAEARVPIEQQWENEPYLGLRAFDLQHAPIFFGREQEAGRVLEALQAQQRHGCAFVLLVGGSGSGKSSLVRAGVIPDLIESGDEECIVWRRAVLTPGECADGLLPGLAGALLDKDALPELRDDDGVLKELAEAFGESQKQAAQQVRRALQRLSVAPAATHLVLLVDQFEEVFTHAAFSEADIQAFAEALKALAECGRVSILATVRSDYYGRCQQVPALMTMKAPVGQIDLVAPGQTALARIIRGPAQLAGLRFEESRATGETLDQRIIADIGNNPEALPLVEFALTRLWENRAPDGSLTFAQYDALGGVAGAIGHHAEAVYQTLPGDVRAEFATVFNSLVTLNEADDAQPVRRRVALDAVTGTPTRKRFVEALNDARLLTSDRGELFVAHEALLRVWERAKDWIEANRDFLRIRAQVDQRMNQSGILVPEDPLFDRAKAELVRNRDRFTPEQAALIEQAIATAERKQHRAHRIRRMVMTGLSALTILSIIGGVSAWTQRNEADRQRQAAEAAETEAVAAKEKVEVANAAQDELLKINKQQLHAASMADYAVAVQRIEKDGKWHEGVAHLARALDLEPDNYFAAARLYSTISFYGHEKQNWPHVVLWQDGQFGSAQFSPDGTRVVTINRYFLDGNDRSRAQVWNAATGQPEGKPMQFGATPANSVDIAQFSPDGLRILTASWNDPSPQVWSSSIGQTIVTLSLVHNVRSAQFSPDGTRILTASDTAQVWDAETGEPVGEPINHGESVESAQFSPDGTRIVTLNAETARVWNALTGQTIGIPIRHSAMVNNAHFSPDSTRVVTAGDKTAQVWDAATGTPISKPMRHGSTIRATQFSPDGTRVATASDDETARIWDAATGNSIGEPMRHNGSVWNIQFSPDGMYIVTSSGEIARVWDASTGQMIGEPMCHGGMIHTVHFSPDGMCILTASDDGTARVWKAFTHQKPGEPIRQGNADDRVITDLSGNTTQVVDAAIENLVRERFRPIDGFTIGGFSSDGKRVVTIRNDKKVQVWDVATGKAIIPPIQHIDPVMNARFSGDNSRIITMDDSRIARVWAVSTGNQIGKPIHQPGGGGGFDWGQKFNGDASRAVARHYLGTFKPDVDNTATVLDVETGNPIGETMRHNGPISSAQFSPNYQYILTAGGDRIVRLWSAETGKPIGDPLHHQDGGRGIRAWINKEGTLIITAGGQVLRVWNMSTLIDAPVPVPEWMREYARAVAGVEFDKDGELKFMALDRRLTVLKNPPEDNTRWAVLARWLSAPADKRTLTPDSKFTLMQIAERERDFNGIGTIASLTSSLEYSYSLPLTRLLLSNALEKDNAAKKPEEQDETIPVRAAFLRRYDLDRLPDDPFLWSRAARALIDAPDGAMVAIGPKAVTAKAAALPTAEKAVALLDHTKPHPTRLNLAHAYLLNDQFEKAQTIYAKYLGTAFEDGRAWNDELRNDFMLLREAGHDHPDMKRIKALLEQPPNNNPEILN